MVREFRAGRLLTRTVSGEGNRSWRSQVRNHSNATTFLNGEFVTRNAVPGFAKLVYNFNDGTGQHEEWVAGDLVGYHYPPSAKLPTPDLPEAMARAQAAFYKQIRQTQVQISGPTFLGEARETLKMLRRPAAGLQDLCGKYLKTLKNRKGKGKLSTKDLTKAAGDLWLESAFGWTPLLADARDAAKAWNRLFDTERIVPVSAFGSQSKDLTNYAGQPENQGMSGSNYIYLSVTRQRIGTRIVKIRGAVRAEAKTGARAQLGLFGFTPSEFLPTAWELLPWSFLVDYFTNIGEIIQSGVTDTSSLIWCSAAVVDMQDENILAELNLPYIKSIIGPWLIRSEYRPSAAFHTYRSVARSPNFGLSPPNLYFSIPGSDKQLANIAALLATASALHPQRR